MGDELLAVKLDGQWRQKKVVEKRGLEKIVDRILQIYEAGLVHDKGKG
jgi:hypothetical protein